MQKIKNLSSTELTRFSTQLATLISAGIPLVQALTVMKQGQNKEHLTKLISKMIIYLEKGYSFSDTLKQFPKCFDALYCGLIASGEQSGTLARMLNRIAAYQERNQSLKRKVKKAMMYPFTVLIVAVIVTCLLLLKVVPIFSVLYQNSNAQLPAFTQFLLEISELLQRHGYLILLSGGLCVTSLLYLYRHQKHPKFRQVIQHTILKIPVLKMLINHTLLARITRTLSTTLTAGIPLAESLETIAQGTSPIVYNRLLTQVQLALKKGQSLYQALLPVKQFEPMVLQMINIGESSGSLDTMLNKIASHYEEKMESSIDACMILLEPLIMILLGVVIGGLVIGLYLPIFNMGSVF